MRDQFRVVALAAGTRWKELAEQVILWGPELVAITDDRVAKRLSDAVRGHTRVLSGPQSLFDLVDQCDFDIAVIGVVGMAALPATIRAVERGKRVALANKESLVVAGSIIAPLATRSRAELIPIDSEHSAVFQAMHAGRECDVRRVILTASGGPFRTWPLERMAHARVSDALNHPTWCMGPKITIDCATMMNKALEVVEARWLFGLSPDEIEVIIHPESIVHSLVEFVDGSMVAQLGTPDMRTPIQYALTYPARQHCPSPPLDLAAISTMHFEPPDVERFPALRLGHEVATRGGTAGAVFNAANESAVHLFRDQELAFGEIASSVEHVLQSHECIPDPTLDDLLSADQWARQEVLRCTTV